MSGAGKTGPRWAQHCALSLPLALFAGFVVLAVVGMVRPGNR